MAPPTLEGRGLHLRPIDPAYDAEPLHAAWGDAAQLSFMVLAPCASVDETAALLQGWSNDPASPQWAILNDMFAATAGWPWGADDTDPTAALRR